MEFSILGPLEVRSSGEPLVLGGPKQRALLAILLLNADRVVSRDRLIAELWGEEPPGAARHALDVNVSRLLKALGTSGASNSVLITRAPGYLLRVAPGELDLRRFERLVEDGRRAFEVGDPEAAAHALRDAEGLWRGRPLADLEFEPFARIDVERLEELHLVAVEQRVDAELVLSRHLRLVGELEALVAQHPLRERLRAQLMLALYRSGRQADALASYRRARTALVEQVGIEPGPELRALHEAILGQDPTLDAPAAVELPQELATRSPLVGREAELERLRGAWERARGGGCSIAVLTGPAGIGRTRLAAELAGEVHRQGAVVAYAVDALPRPPSARRPALLVIDDLDRTPADALAGLARELDSKPVLVVAITGDAGLSARLPADEHLALGPLSPDAIGAIAELYAPQDAEIPIVELAARSGGVPQRAHRLAAEWASARAARRLSPVADRAAAERSGLRRTERRLAGSVLELQAIRERAALLEGGPATGACPFQGLSGFDVADAGLFFGRERLVAEMVARLAGSPLLGVVGASGSGKSSALRAGLLAELAAGALPGSEGWAQVLLRPGEHPLRALEQARAEAGPNGRALVAVDQFEETFTLCRNDAERAAFADALVAAAQPGEGAAGVVLAVRADFYARCGAYPELARLLSAGHVLVGPMRRDELRRAIEQPAQRAALRLAPELVERLLDDVQGEPGALPLLSSALLELWQQRDGRELPQDTYERLGGVRGAVARLAETAYESLDAAQQAVARRILERLAGEDTGGGAVRRRVELAELDADRDDAVRHVLDVLAGSRLVIISRGTAEVAHEALLREWPRLQGWLEEDAAGRRAHHQLALAARDWDAGGRDPGELYRGARLAAALNRRRAHPAELNTLERKFIEAGRADNERERQRARRTSRRLRALRTGVAALLVVVVAAGALFLDQRGRSRDQARSADAQRTGARALLEPDLDRALLLARQGVAIEDSRATRGQLLAALMRSPAAIGVARFGDSGGLTQVALSPDGRTLVLGDNHGTLRFLDAVTRHPLRAPYRPAPSSYFRHIQFSPDGSRLEVDGVGMMQLLDGHTFRPLASVKLPPGEIQYINVAFSPDSRVLTAMYEQDGALGGSENRSPKAVLLRFDGRTGRAIGRPVTTYAAGPLADLTAFGPGGRWFLTATSSSTKFTGSNGRPVVRGSAITLRDPRTLRPLRSFPAMAVTGALAPDRRTLAIGRKDGSIRFLDLRTGAVRIASGRHSAEVRGARFTPDGRSLVTVGDDAKVFVWDVGAAAATETLEGHDGPAVGLAIDRRAQTLHTVGFEGSLITWDLAGARRLGRPLVAATSSADRFISTAVSPDGRTLATPDGDGSLSLVDLATLSRRRLAIAGMPTVGSAPAFGARETLVAGGAGGRLAIVDAGSGHILSRLRGHRDRVFTPAAGDDGRTIASTGEDGTLRLWDARTAQPLGPPMRLDGRPAAGPSISRDGTQVAVPLVSGAVAVFDVRTHRLVANLRPDGSWPTFANFSSDGRRLLVGTEDGRVRIYSAHDRRPLGPAFAADRGTVSSVDMSPDGRTLVTAGIDGQVRLWDAASRKAIGTPLPGSESLDAVASFTPDGDHVVAVFANGRGYLWDVRLSSWKRHACEVAGRRLTRAEWQDALPGRDYAPAC